MDKTTLSLLDKSTLIDVILSDKSLENRAFHRVLDAVSKKIEAIITEQEHCDLNTQSGWKRYTELEKEYKKWDKIMQNI